MSDLVDQQLSQPYKYGWVTDVESDVVPAGLSEDVIRLISMKKDEPEWLLNWRLKAYRNWLKMVEPTWANVEYEPIDYQAIHYYAAPKQKTVESLDEVDPKVLEAFEKLGIPLEEQQRLAGVAVDAVFDSVSVATTFKETLAEHGVIFLPFSEAVREYPDLVRKYLGSVVPPGDNFHAALNSAVFSVPDGVIDLFQDQRSGHWAIRENVDSCRRGCKRELPRRLLGANAGREPITCCSRGTRRPG